MNDVTFEEIGLEQLEEENTSLEELDTEDVHLFFVGIDVSASMEPYIKAMEDSLTEFKDAIKNSKEEEHILLAQARFSSNVDLTGYKKVDEFDTTFKVFSSTAMFDAITMGKEKLLGTDDILGYMTHLRNEGMRVKAVFVLFSDGYDNDSRATLHDAKNAIQTLNQAEVTTAFITFGDDAEGIADDLGFTNNLKVGSSASELREAMRVLSKSVIESSQSILPDKDKFYV